MHLQALVSTMHQTDYSLLPRMNIQSDAIVVNQCDRNEFEELNYQGHTIRWLSFRERGVGLSRNNALMRATADICLLADDDVTYCDGYAELVLDTFRENPKADVIVFNVPSTHPRRKEYIIPRKTRVRFHNGLRYATFRIAIRTESIRKANIHFTLIFGGGTRYSGGGGDDSLFLVDCLKQGLKIYAVPIEIGTVSHSESTWLDGNRDKYLHDKGALFAAISKAWSPLLSLQFVIRHRRLFQGEKTLKEACALMLRGRQSFLGRSLE